MITVIAAAVIAATVAALIWQVNRLDRRLWQIERTYCCPDDDGCACGGLDCIMGGPE